MSSKGWWFCTGVGASLVPCRVRKGAAYAPGLLAFVARFVTAGPKKFTELNSRIETSPDGSNEIVAFEGINPGFAAQTDRGLIVPSILAAEKMTARELEAEIRRLTEEFAKERPLRMNWIAGCSLWTITANSVWAGPHHHQPSRVGDPRSVAGSSTSLGS